PRSAGSIKRGIQAIFPAGPLSRGIGRALNQALASEPGTPVTAVRLDQDSPRLQQLLDLDRGLEIAVHYSLELRIDPGAERSREVEQSITQANESIMPTMAIEGLPHAYWVDAGSKEHLRWVLDADEDAVNDAVTRLHARRESG